MLYHFVFFDIPIEDIKSANVENPISLGDDISSKKMVLDVKTLLNDDKFINLEIDVTSHLFSSKFSISVVDLNEISIATEEDKSRHRDLWASFFKAKTWEEINMLAQKDSVINEAAAKMYQLTEDQRIREQCFAREDYIRRERDRDHYFTTEIQKRDDMLVQKDATIADKDATIAALQAQLAKYQSVDQK